MPNRKIPRVKTGVLISRGNIKRGMPVRKIEQFKSIARVPQTVQDAFDYRITRPSVRFWSFENRGFFYTTEPADEDMYWAFEEITFKNGKTSQIRRSKFKTRSSAKNRAYKWYVKRAEAVNRKRAVQTTEKPS